MLLNHPRIFDAAVYGVPHEKWGQVGKASIVLKEGEEMAAEQVVRFLQRKIGRFKIPRYVEFVDDLPGTATGKIKRHVLAERFKRSEIEVEV